MKRNLAFVLCAALIATLICGCSQQSDDGEAGGAQNQAETAQAQTKAALGFSDAALLIADVPTVQYFTDEPVGEADIEKILYAGVNAPSAMNQQPWHFTAITDASVLQEIADGMSFSGGKPPADDSENPDAAEYPKNAGEKPEEMEKQDDAGENPDGKTQPPNKKPDDEMGPDLIIEDTEATSDAPQSTAIDGAPSEPPASSSKAGLTDAPLVIVVSCEEDSKFDAGLACQNMSAEAQLLGYGTKIISSLTMALNGERQAEFSELLGIPEGQKAVALLLIGVEDTTVDTTADTYTGATERDPFDDIVTYVKPQ